MTVIYAKCYIKDIGSTHAFEEELKVTSTETAKEDVEAIISKYNDTLRGSDKPRELVKIISTREEEKPEEENDAPECECNECGWEGKTIDLDSKIDDDGFDVEACPACDSDNIWIH
jgi:hypothetical protein